ncbi:MAG TPA: LysE family translocator [Steroidobacteraceae bacterium]|jgi:homoserine/homoserine lactone efflux protein
MTSQTWILFCLTETVLCLIPGPAVLFVLGSAVRRGFSPGLTAAAGILAGNTFYFALSATGIAAIILASHRVFSLLKWAGAAYLVWLGLRLLLSRTAAPASASAPRPADNHRGFMRGFLVQAANPKALVFFIALLPQFINPAASVPWQILILGVSSVAIEFVVLSGYAALAARARHLTGARFAQSLERIGGAFLVAAGARLAWSRVL